MNLIALIRLEFQKIPKTLGEGGPPIERKKIVQTLRPYIENWANDCEKEQIPCGFDDSESGSTICFVAQLPYSKRTDMGMIIPESVDNHEEWFKKLDYGSADRISNPIQLTETQVNSRIVGKRDSSQSFYQLHQSAVVLGRVIKFCVCLSESVTTSHAKFYYVKDAKNFTHVSESRALLPGISIGEESTYSINYSLDLSEARILFSPGRQDYPLKHLASVEITPGTKMGHNVKIEKHCFYFHLMSEIAETKSVSFFENVVDIESLPGNLVSLVADAMLRYQNGIAAQVDMGNLDHSEFYVIPAGCSPLKEKPAVPIISSMLPFGLGDTEYGDETVGTYRCVKKD